MFYNLTKKEIPEAGSYEDMVKVLHTDQWKNLTTLKRAEMYVSTDQTPDGSEYMLVGDINYLQRLLSSNRSPVITLTSTDYVVPKFKNIITDEVVIASIEYKTYVSKKSKISLFFRLCLT